MHGAQRPGHLGDQPTTCVWLRARDHAVLPCGGAWPSRVKEWGRREVGGNGKCKWHTGHPVVRCPVCGVAARGHKSGAHEGPHVSLFQPLRWTNSVMPQPSWARQSSRERRQARRRLSMPFRRSQARRECKQKGPLYMTGIIYSSVMKDPCGEKKPSFYIDSTDPFATNPHRCVSPPSGATAAWQCFVR